MLQKNYAKLSVATFGRRYRVMDYADAESFSNLSIFLHKRNANSRALAP